MKYVYFVSYAVEQTPGHLHMHSVFVDLDKELVNESQIATICQEIKQGNYNEDSYACITNWKLLRIEEDK